MANATAAVARQAPLPSCPSCGRQPNRLFRSREEIAAELATRARFFERRLNRRYSWEELRDLTNVVAGVPSEVHICDSCHILVRSDPPDEQHFADDDYDDAILRSLHAAHVAAFREKRRDYEPLLPPGARIMEVGSYVGGFLVAAREWGWKAAGIDVGRSVNRFVASLGLDVHSRFERCDAVFNWNCFEQMNDPAVALEGARRLLRPGGILVLRVPDADLYIDRHDSVRLLGYNALLGWPHRFGFSISSLCALASRHGFEVVRVLRRPAIRPLREAMLPWARAEERALMRGRNLGWIEVTFA
jgi:SAM-dependent methyltransferase